MVITKAIREVMRTKGMSLIDMAHAIGKNRAGDVSARLAHSNMTFDKAVEMLDALGCEVVIQDKGKSLLDRGQIVVDQKPEYDLEKILK